MEDYVKTGEDKNFTYYRNDSEVLSGDGEELPYEQIVNKKEDFTVKILDKVIVIKKRSFNRIMILSECIPEEQLIFGLYKTELHGKTSGQINISTQPIGLDGLRGAEPKTFSNNIDPLSGETVGTGNNNDININVNANVVNIPTNEDSDKEESSLRSISDFNANYNSQLLIVGLPPEAVRAKWFYLLLALVGIFYVILCFAGIINSAVGFTFGIFFAFLIGVVLILTGIFGFLKINNKIYDNRPLFFLTIACPILGILGSIILVANSLTKGYFVPSLFFAILDVIFSVLCIIWTNKLKNQDESTKQKNLERLVDSKK